MADNPDRDRSVQPGVAGMLGWLAFFLLVFALAGLGFYLADDPGNGIPR